MMQMVLDAAADAGLASGCVAGLADDGGVTVLLADGRRLECARLHACDAGLTLAAGDEVLVHRRGGGTGVVVGRIGPSSAGAAPVEATPAVPDELVIEAGSSLTLRVGGGSITLREDGRILIKGSDLVSHAARMNRIRGGSVDIN
jgi:hypothetical protein